MRTFEIPLAVFVFGSLAVVNAEDAILFNRDVRPILSDNCWACHGPDANKRKAKLRLDQRESAVKEVIVPGDPESSPMVERIFSDDPEEVMPPADHRKKLTAAQKETLRKWIAQGAKWQDHWGWIPPVRKKDANIDGFIKRKLAANGLDFSSEADKYTLIRRLSFDVRGLPPSVEEVKAFVADASPDAFAKLVDAFLDSPAFGERMAVYWLDLVRYADSNGYHADLEWSVSPYRDYVINAFNANMPFDQFTIEQIAGDLLPNATVSQRVAAGYNRLNMKSTEFGIQDKEYLAKYAADRVRTTSTAWLGVTLGCSECHDHKFDPFTARDFYSFAAFFADIKGLGYYPDAQRKGWGETMEVPDPAKAKRLTELEQKLASMKSTDVLPDSRKAGQPWIYTTEKPADGWEKPEFDHGGWKAGEGGFGSKGTPNSAIRTEWKTGDIWLRRNFRIEEIPSHLTLRVQHDEDATVFLNGTEVASFKGHSTESPEYATQSIDPKALKTGENVIAIRCHQTSGGQFIDAGLVADGEGRAALEKEIAELRKSTRKMLATVSVKPRTMRILPRGNWMDDSGEVVGPATPEFLGGKKANSRLQLADWITARENPLTARVFVNRLWKMFFGTGLSRVLDDIGSQGEWPSHPELLDWLAVEFVESGWNVKHVVRLMLTSRTYRQSSLENDRLRELDPQNRLLARQSRFRLDAEFIRDNALAVSGLLVREIGGPSVKPYQPGGYWDNLFFPKRNYNADKGSKQYRRGLYTHWQRQFLHPALLAFDAPSREECTADRPRSNTPLAALVLLNDPTQVEAARLLAESIAADSTRKDDDARLRAMIFRVLTRPAGDAEVAVLLDLLNKHREDFAANREDANRLASVGQHPVSEKINQPDLAPWISVARALLNLHETITRN